MPNDFGQIIWDDTTKQDVISSVEKMGPPGFRLPQQQPTNAPNIVWDDEKTPETPQVGQSKQGQYSPSVLDKMKEFQAKSENFMVNKIIEPYQKARQEYSEDIKASDNVVTNFLGDLFSFPFVPADIAAEKMKTIQKKKPGLDRAITGMVEMGKLPLEFGQFFLNSVSDLLVASRINPLADKKQIEEAQQRVKEHPGFVLVGALGAGGILKGQIAPKEAKPREMVEEKPIEEKPIPKTEKEPVDYIGLQETGKEGEAWAMVNTKEGSTVAYRENKFELKPEDKTKLENDLKEKNVKLAEVKEEPGLEKSKEKTLAKLKEAEQPDVFEQIKSSTERNTGDAIRRNREHLTKLFEPIQTKISENLKETEQYLQSTGQKVVEEVKADAQKEGISPEAMYAFDPKSLETVNFIEKAFRKVKATFDTESPFKSIGAPKTAQEVKNTTSRYVAAEEKAIKEVKEFTKMKLDNEGYSDAYLVAANSEYAKTLSPERIAELKPAVDRARAMFDEYEKFLVDENVLEVGWPESAIRRINDEIFGLQAERLKAKGKSVKKLTDEIKKKRDDIDRLQSLKYLHLPIRLWLENLYENNPDGFRTILSGNFSSIKGRKTIDPYDLVKANLLDKNVMDIRDAVGIYTRYVEMQKAQKAIRDVALSESIAVPKELDDPRFDQYIPLDDRRFPIFSKQKLHPIFADYLVDYFDGMNQKGNSFTHAMSFLKMLQFYNPVIMPMYDTYQASVVTQGQFGLNLKRAVRDVIKKNDNYFEAYDNGLFSTPYKSPFDSFVKSLERSKEYSSVKKAIEYEAKRIGKNPARILSELYQASWNIAWFGDKILRMSSYNALRKRGYSPREAAQFAAEAHADYAGVPPKTRRAANHVFFTPTFQISMLKWHSKMIGSIGRLPVSTIKSIAEGEVTPKLKRDIVRTASVLTAVGLLASRDYTLTNYLGWEREQFGRKYKKKIKQDGEDKEVVVTFSDPLNVSLKYYYSFFEDRPTMTKPEQWAKYGQFWLHPAWQISLHLAKNEREDGTPIANPFDSYDKQFIDISRYIGSRVFSMYRGLIDEPENTKEAAMKALRDADDTPINQLMKPFAFFYMRKGEDTRIKRQVQALMQEFSTNLRTRPPQTQEQLKSQFDKLDNELEKLFNEADEIETKKVVANAQLSNKKNKEIATAIIGNEGQFKEKEYELYQTAKQKLK